MANPINHIFTMTMNGTLTPLPNGTTGLPELDDLMEELRTAFNRDGKLLEIKCDATVIMQIYPKIISVDFQESSNNWVQTVPFTIELEYCYDELNEHPTGEAPPFIEEYNEEWNMEFVQEQKHFTWDLSGLTNQKAGDDYTASDQNSPFQARVTHTVSAKGKQTFAGPAPALTGTETTAADNALNWLNTVYNDFGYDATAFGHAMSGWNNLTSTDYTALDHIRSHVVNETDGTVTLSESWLILGNQSGLGAAARKMTEDFTVNIRQNIDNGKVEVSVDGQIAGLEERSYATPESLSPVTTSAYDNATAAWAQIQNRVFPRAQFIFQQDFSTILNPNPVNMTVAHQPSQGIINYTYDFNDRPCAFITGALSENFTINDNNPADVFAQLPVLGRAQGPILQEISTVTAATRSVTIEAVMPQPTGCSSITDLDLNKPTENVKNLLCDFQTQLTSAYDQVFKNSDTENWNPLTGRYSRAVVWTYQECSGNPTTSLC